MLGRRNTFIRGKQLMKKVVPIYSQEMYDFIKCKTVPAHNVGFLKRLWIRVFGTHSVGTDTSAGGNTTVVHGYVYRDKIYVLKYEWSETC